MRAVILAGGRGTRLRPLTDTRPKPLVPFMGAPYAEGLLRRLAAVGVDTAVFLVGQEAEPFAGLTDLPVAIDVQVVTEERPLDTAGAARRLLRDPAWTGDAFVCNGDVLSDLDLAVLLEAHANADAAATLALTRVDDTSSFGVVETDDRGRITAFLEKPAPGTTPANTVNAGTYVLADHVFDRFEGDGPLSFERDVFPGLLAAGERMLGVPDDGHWADLGTPRRYLDGHRAVLDGRCQWPHSLSPRPGRVAVHPSAAIAEDARLGPHAVIGARATVGPRASVTDSVLLDDAVVEADAVVTGAIVGAGAVVGREVAVAPGTVLGDGQVLR